MREEYLTWLQIYQKMAAELDLELEDFETKEQLAGYANDAIAEIEAEIHTIYEDYFLTLGYLDFQLGQDEVPLPADLYAMKVRSIWFKSGSATALASVTAVTSADVGILGVDSSALLSVNQQILLKEGSEPSTAFYVTDIPDATHVELSATFGGEPADLGEPVYTTAARIHPITNNDQDFYELERLRDWRKFQQYRLARELDSSTLDYRYFVINRTQGRPAIKITPVPRESRVGAAEIWYIRNANRLLLDDDICDIPEFVQFIYDHIRVKVYEDEQHPALALAITDKTATKRRMTETLTAMVPDTANTIELDTSHYEESN